MKKLLINIALFFISFGTIHSQDTNFVRYYSSSEMEVRRQGMKSEYGKNKSIPDSLELAFLTAVSYYPELKDVHISFKYTKIKTTLNVRPSLLSALFRKKENRRYVIRVNNDPKRSEVLVDQVPFNAQVGLLGHELAHIVDYQQLGIGGLLERGVGYMNADYRRKYEYQIDRATITAGLGWQLQDWSDFIQQNPKIDKAYKKYKAENYMGRSTITNHILELVMEQQVEALRSNW